MTQQHRNFLRSCFIVAAIAVGVGFGVGQRSAATGLITIGLLIALIAIFDGLMS